MKFLEFFSAFISQSLSFLSPNQIIDKIVERFQRSLKAIIILTVCTAMSCVSLAYLIDRFLDQLDAGELSITRSMIFLLVLLVGFVGALVYTLMNLTRKEEQIRKANEIQKTESALEAALAALIMSYVQEREEKRKAKPETTPL